MTNVNPQANGRGVDESPFQYILGVLRRNPLLVLGVPLLVLVATAVFVLYATPVYEAMVSIRIDEQRSNVALLDALSTLSSGSQVGTEMEVLRSRTLAEGVVDSLQLRFMVVKPRRVPRSRLFDSFTVAPGARPGEYRLTRQRDGRFAVEAEYPVAGPTNPLWPFGATETVAFGDVGVGETKRGDGITFRLAPGAQDRSEIRFAIGERQEVVKDLRSEIEVNRPNRDADIVVVRYEHYDPELVQEITNDIARQFIERRQSVQRTEAVSTVDFLHEQIDTLSRQLNTAEEALKTFREQNQVVALEAEADAQVERLADMQGQRDMLESEREALAELLAEVQASRTSETDESPYRRLIAFPSLLRNAAATELLRMLGELENQQAELLSRRRPEDPDVAVLTDRIRSLEEQLRSIATTYLGGLTSQVASMDRNLAQFQEELSQIPAKEITLARIQREASVLGDIFSLLQTRLKEAEIAAAVEDGSVRVVDPAIGPLEPIRPRGLLSMVLALLLGTVGGIGAALAKEQLDTAVHTRDEVQRVTGLTVLGVIPSIHELAGNGGRVRRAWRRASATSEPRLIASQDPQSPVSEAYRSLRTNITFSRLEEAPKTLVFTSSMPGDGKSTTAVNLAVTLAQQGLSILLVDADMRRGELHDAFNVDNAPGLSNVLLGEAEHAVVAQRVELERGTLHFLPTGTIPPNPAELLGAPRMKALLQELRKAYDYVILDAPPLNVVTDAAILGTHADGVLLVARAGVSEAGALNYAIDQLRHVQAPVLGAVLNDVDFKRQRYYGGSYAYYSNLRS